ncbi:hypothetical protein M0R45_030804 [Rubus argutus]|uniref:Uncharacterized protein n=2 Tax=Rubus argutus TaxID=59490 RepID=A0AAW1WCF1_RUBAR
MGFGPLHLFRSSKLHRPLCQMLVDNFDLANCSIHIHGRSLSINHVDFELIMGVQDGGSPVDLDGSLDDPDIVELTRKVFGDKEMSVDVLKNLIHNTKKADDTFRISFSLYALAILLCPSTSDKVDPRFLLPLRDPAAVCKNNWATLCFTKLVERLMLFKDRSQYLGGCLVFLQLFYLDSIVSTPPTLYKNMVPATAWGKKESKRV